MDTLFFVLRDRIIEVSVVNVLSVFGSEGLPSAKHQLHITINLIIFNNQLQLYSNHSRTAIEAILKIKSRMTVFIHIS